MVERDTYEANDTTPFDETKLQSIETLRKYILHSKYGKDVRPAMAQLPDALIKALQDSTDLGQLGAIAEVIAARGSFESLPIHETAQDNAIQNNSAEIVNANQKSSNALDVARSAASGSPREAFANIEALKAKYPNGASGIYVTQNDGYWWVWLNGGWQKGLQFQSAGVADASVDPVKLQDNSRSTPIILAGPGGAPDYDDNKKTLTFGSTDKGSAILFWSKDQHYEIPAGTAIVNGASQQYTSTKLIFDTATKKFSYVAWNINLTSTQFVVLSQKESWGSPTGQTIISANFPVTVNGRLQGSSHGWAHIIPSTLLKPNYDDKRHVFDFNSLKRQTLNEKGKWEPQACLVLDSQNAHSTKTFIIPKDTKIVNEVAAGSKSSWAMLIFNENDENFRFQQMTSNLFIGDWIIAVVRDNTYATDSNLMQTVVTANGPVTVNGLNQSLVINEKNANVRGILHRGVSDYAPEESWQAYQLAYQFGYYNVEGDVHFTKDGVPVMIHDETINRVAVNKADKSEITGNVAVAESYYQDLLSGYDFCKINGYVQPHYYETQLLSFEDLLRLCKKYNYALHAEIKVEMTDEQIETLVYLARKYGMENNIFWQAFNPDWFKHLKEVMPDSKFCFLIESDPTDNLITTMKSYQTGLPHNRVYAYVSQKVDQEKLMTYKENDIDVVVWTLYSDAAVQDWGLNTCVSGIMVQGDTNVARAMMQK